MDEIVVRCKEAVEAWRLVEAHLLRATLLPSGSNTVYLVQTNAQVIPAAVIYRHFGALNVTDADTERRVFQYLGEVGFGPKTYTCSGPYRVEECLPGRPLHRLDLKHPHIISLVCAALREFHSIDVSMVLPTTGVPALVQNCARWRANVICELLPTSNPEVQAILSEETWIDCMELLPKQAPLVFCHHDCYYLNFLYTEHRVRLVDYEHAGYGYRGMDIAFALNEMLYDYENPNPPYVSYHPEDRCSDELLAEYTKAYGGGAELWVEARLCQCVGQFIWAVWALAISQQGRPGFDYLNFAIMRMHDFWSEKKLLQEAGGLEGLFARAHELVNCRE